MVTKTPPADVPSPKLPKATARDEYEIFQQRWGGWKREITKASILGMTHVRGAQQVRACKVVEPGPWRRCVQTSKHLDSLVADGILPLEQEMRTHTLYMATITLTKSFGAAVIE